MSIVGTLVPARDGTIAPVVPGLGVWVSAPTGEVGDMQDLVLPLHPLLCLASDPAPRSQCMTSPRCPVDGSESATVTSGGTWTDPRVVRHVSCHRSEDFSRGCLRVTV